MPGEKVREYPDFRYATPVSPPDEVGHWVCVSGLMGEVGTGRNWVAIL